MMIFIGSDHRGVALKKALQENLPTYTWNDVGTHTEERTDYPCYAHKVCQGVLETANSRGILICQSGIGMSIAANRYKKIYGALCWNESVAAGARSHNNANVLILPAGLLSLEESIAITKTFLATPFLQGQYQTRLCMIDGE